MCVCVKCQAETKYLVFYCLKCYISCMFTMQWVRIQPTGIVHFKTKDDGFHYSWNKPHTVIHNLILGSLWADHVSILCAFGIVSCDCHVIHLCKSAGTHILNYVCFAYFDWCDNLYHSNRGCVNSICSLQ